jgi:hypothetical protein
MGAPGYSETFPAKLYHSHILEFRSFHILRRKILKSLNRWTDFDKILYERSLHRFVEFSKML